MTRVQDGVNCSMEDAVYGKFQDGQGNTIKFSKMLDYVSGVVSDDGKYMLEFGSTQNLKISKLSTINKVSGQNIVKTVKPKPGPTFIESQLIEIVKSESMEPEKKQKKKKRRSF